MRSGDRGHRRADYLLDPPRSCVATWYGLLAEMLLAGGAPDAAADALDRAESCPDRYGQRYPEGLLFVQRADAFLAGLADRTPKATSENRGSGRRIRG